MRFGYSVIYYCFLLCILGIRTGQENAFRVQGMLLCFCHLFHDVGDYHNGNINGFTVLHLGVHLGAIKAFPNKNWVFLLTEIEASMADNVDAAPAALISAMGAQTSDFVSGSSASTCIPLKLKGASGEIYAQAIQNLLAVL